MNDILKEIYKHINVEKILYNDEEEKTILFGNEGDNVEYFKIEITQDNIDLNDIMTENPDYDDY